MNTDPRYEIVKGDCLEWLCSRRQPEVHLTFVDPPFRQGKEYKFFDDNQPEDKYWAWLGEVLSHIRRITVDGGAVYFMHREKNAERVLRLLREGGWAFQSLIIWKKRTSAVPCQHRYSKQYQIIAFATKGEKARVFNKLRIDLPVRPEYKAQRANGVYVTDVWDDIRELTSGYFAGDEAIRTPTDQRAHTQQSPVALLLRIILTSALPGDTVLDPFAGTGTTLVVARQLKRNSIGIEIDPDYAKIVQMRVKCPRASDSVMRYYQYYRYTEHLNTAWGVEEGAVIAESVGV